MTQPLSNLEPEDVFEDHPAETDLSSEASSRSEASTESHAESETEELHSSVTNSRSTCSYAYHQLNAPPPSPASSVESSSSDSALEPSLDTSSDGMEEDCSFIDIGSYSEGFSEAHFSDQDGEEVEDNSSFVDEGSQPAGFDRDQNGDQEASWALFGAAVSSNKDHDEKICAVGRWIDDTP